MTKNKILNFFCFIQIKVNKRKDETIYSQMIFILIHLIFIANVQSKEKSEINLIIISQEKIELNFLSNLFYKEPSDVIINEVSKPLCKRSCELMDGLNNITIKFNNFIESFENMFEGITSIIEIDLSNFDSSRVTNMYRMFSDCINLQKISLGNMNTSSVKNMGELFNNCKNLTMIDRLNFNTSSVNNMRGMFRHCESLNSLILEFNPKNVEDMNEMFAYCYKIIFIKLINFNGPKVQNMEGMFYKDFELKFVDLSNFQGASLKNIKSMFRFCSSLIFINLYSYKINTGTIITYLFDSTFPDLKICINNAFTRNGLQKYYSNKFDCSDICFNKDTKIDFKENKCLKNCDESDYKYEYDNFCYPQCPDKTFPIDKEYKCVENTPVGYYLDDDLIFKKCYDTCETCSGAGNDLNNNCTECKREYVHSNGKKYNFLYELNINGYKNCYIKCPYYFYFDKNSNKYYCTENSTCYGTYNKLISEKNECVNKCEEDKIYKYEFRKRCYDKCPEGSTGNNTIINEYFCKPICTEENPFEFVFTQECVKNCPLKDIKENTCIQNFMNKKDDNVDETDNNKENKEEDTKAQDIMLENIETGFTSQDYNTSNLEKGEDDVYKDEKMTVTLTTTQNQKNNTNNNLTIIDLGECENILRKEYNISDDKTIYMKKIDVIQKGMKIPKIEYDVYCKLSGDNLEKLDLSVCEHSQISLSIPVQLTESLDILNSSSGYYNDICYTATSDSGTDISLKDRKNEFIEGNKTICQEECDFSEYDYTSQKAKCTCKVKESSLSLADMKVNTTKLFENFVDIKNTANIKLLACYKKLFTGDGLKNNIAFYITIPIIIFHIVVIFIFYFNKKKKISDFIEDITFGINNWEILQEEERKARIRKRKEILIRASTKKLNLKNLKDNKNNQKEFDNKIKINEIKEISKVNEKIDIESEKDEQKVEVVQILNPIDYYFLTEVLNKQQPPIKRNGKTKLKGNNKIITFMKKKNNKNLERKNTYNKNNLKDILNKTKKIMEFNDSEKNSFTYELALKYDRRTFIEFYISLLKTNHLFIFSFFYNNDYNSKIIKIDLFFINFIVNYAINALFFNDNTMHKIYEDEGSFNFVYQLPQIIYSTLVSMALGLLLQLLALPENDILEYKKDKNKNNLDERKSKLYDKIKIKFVSYFIASFIFLLFFWYYLSMFCAIYINTQRHLINDSLISFGLSLIYPFGIYLLPAFFRKLSLSNPKSGRSYLYKLSQFLLIF